MSTESNTYQELSINNNCNATAIIAEKVGKYLLLLENIYSLNLVCDGKKYELNEEEESIEEGTEIHKICQTLKDYKQIEVKMRDCSFGDFIDDRIEKLFGDVLDNEEVKNNVIYRTLEYYDTDSIVCGAIFDKNGLFYPTDSYSGELNLLTDIDKWYCYTPDIEVTIDKDNTPPELKKFLGDCYEKIYLLIDKFEDYQDKNTFYFNNLDEDGEIIWNSSIAFSAEKLPDLLNILTSICATVGIIKTAKINLQINTVPAGEKDYDFASIRILFAKGKMSVGACRF